MVPVLVSKITPSKTVAIAGVGGVGGLTAVMLVRQVKIKCLKLADFDSFDISNLNRQHGARHSTIGSEKIKEIAAECRDIDPELKVIEYSSGLNESNIQEFLADTDLLVNAVDYTQPNIFVPLTDQARQLQIPTIVGAEVAYGGRAIWFPPNGMRYSEYFKVKADDTLDIRRLIMRVPTYGDPRALKAALANDIAAPAVAVGGLVTASILVTWIEGILAGVWLPKPAPYSYFSDIIEGKSGYIRYPRLSFYTSLLVTLIRAKFGLNAPTIE